MNTLDFYNADPEGYADATFGADTSHLRDRFVRFLHHGSRILDLGCGSGRDTIAFRQAGFEVVPVDGSEGMCRVAESNTGSEVRMITSCHWTTRMNSMVFGRVHRYCTCHPMSCLGYWGWSTGR
ncbi:MAG: class I SAM-dependent methyltransferase [Candidatus Methanomethylophilaceae archaeon]|nr:class I SAM-dependent methyltransferase [Candidatus Methanomethylophilaceae archaeon]